jgi:hypothetical protein
MDNILLILEFFMKKQEECKKIKPLRTTYECFVKRSTEISQKMAWSPY